MTLGEIYATLTQAAADQLQRVVGYLPNIAAAFVLVLAGWLLARLVGALVHRACAAAVDRIARRPAVGKGLASNSLQSRIPLLVREVAFWGVLLVFLAAAIERLEIPALASPLSALAYYAPRLLSALLIGIGGIVASNIARDWTQSAFLPAGAAQAQALGRAAQIAALSTTLVMAADQAGIRSTILILALGIVLTVSLGALALAFAIGCAPMVSNLVASHYVAKQLSKGQQARVAGHTGVIAAITSAFVILETPEGEILIPARKFLEDATVLSTEA
ncbi:MAG: hypothetical protein R2729_29235 [Bryobacteraceae bacterium]